VSGRVAGAVAALLLAGALACAAPAGAAAAPVRTFWVAAVPAPHWNIVPNERDAIMGMDYEPSQTVFPTVVYRRFTAHWRHPLANLPAGSRGGGQDRIPGPLLRAKVGDRIVVHFKNLDTLLRHPHSMHFHGVHYKPSSDGAYLPGFSGRDADVRPGRTWT
jgi:FtsP/CotA-like multicopper oxidase with cupredoxin domain